MTIVFLFLVQAAPASAGVTASISSGGSTNADDPTRVKMGSTLKITGSCTGGFLATRTAAFFTIYQKDKLAPKVVKNSRLPDSSTDEAYWLDHPWIDIKIGSAYGTTDVGSRFSLSLTCEALTTSDYARRYFEIIAQDAPPKVEWMNTNPVLSNGDTKIQLRVTGTNDGIGKMYLKWTGLAARDTLLRHVSGDVYEYTIPASAMPDGLKQVDVWATSQNGANNGWQAAGSFTLDRTKPAITWAGNDPVIAVNDKVTIKADVQDASGILGVWIRWPGSTSYSIEMKKNSAGLHEYSIDTRNMQPGKKEVVIYATDNAGNITGWLTKGYFLVGSKLPVIVWDKSNPAFATNGEIKVKVHVEAASGVSNVWIRWPDASSDNILMAEIGTGLYEYTINTSKMEPGEKNVDIYARDNVGNNTGWQKKGKFTVKDEQAPIITWHSSNPAFPTDDKITIKVHVADFSGVDAVFMWVFDHDYDTRVMKKIGEGLYAYTIDTSGWLPGKKTVTMWARDNVGNRGRDQEVGEFTVKNKPPAVVWDDSNPAWTRGSIRINVNITDPNSSSVKAWIRWTGVSSTSIEMQKGVGTQYYYEIPAGPDGYKKVEINAEDSEKNATGWMELGQFYVDKSAPTIDDVSTDVDIENGQINIRAIIPDPLTGVRIAWASFSEPPTEDHELISQGKDNIYIAHIKTAEMSDGNHKLRIRAVDYRDNDTGWTEQGAVTLDRTKPVIDWTTPQDMAAFSGDGVNVAGTIADAAPQSVTIEWREENGGAWRSETMPVTQERNTFSYELPDLDGSKQYQLRLRAVDVAGNLSPDTPVRTVQAGHAPEKEKLNLTKTVDKNTAMPGETLRYTITYTNIGSENLQHLVIVDEIQEAFLVLQQAQCGPSNPPGLTCCVASTVNGSCGPTATGPSTMLEWRLVGRLAAGESGSVSYDASIIF